MTINNGPGQLILPALRARMGEWWYYSAAMKMSDVATRVSSVAEIHHSESLKDLLQRRLTSRSEGIANYLLTQEQRLFNSLVVGTYGGDPKWYELSITGSPVAFEQELPPHLDGILGLLVLDGSEKLFAIDGQHRVAGIKSALEKDQSLGDEEVSAIFVAGVTSEHRQGDLEGYERTRRLFTTLNRYAKPVSKGDIIALDEDDSAAIVTRLLWEYHTLFSGRVPTTQVNSIQAEDKTSFTTLATLYDCVDTYLKEGVAWSKFKRSRPHEEKLENFSSRATHLWDTYCKHFPELQTLRNSSPGEGIAGKYRHSEGGHLLFRPVGLLASVQVVRHLIDSMQLSVDEAVQRVAKVPMQLDGKLWNGLLWNATVKRMITTADNRKAAMRRLFYGAGGDLRHLKTDATSLKRELAGLLNKAAEDITLKQFI